MAAISALVHGKLDSLRSAALGGSLTRHVACFVLQVVDGVYAAPGNFRSEQEMLDHLATLTYLIDLHVYKRS